MRTWLLLALLVSTPALAKKVDVDALASRSDQSAVQVMTVVNKAIAKDGGTDGRTRLLRALVRARAVQQDPEFAAANPRWLAQVVEDVLAARDLGVDDEADPLWGPTYAAAHQALLASGEIAETDGMAFAWTFEEPEALLWILEKRKKSGDLPGQIRVVADMSHLLPGHEGANGATLIGEQLTAFGARRKLSQPSLEALRDAVDNASAAIPRVGEGPERDTLTVGLIQALLALAEEQPDRRAAAEERTYAWLNDHPDDVTVLVRWGRYLDVVHDGMDAEDQYDKVFELDPDNKAVLLPAGLHYYNRASDLLKEAANQEDADKAQQYRDKAQPLLDKAYPMIEQGAAGLQNDVESLRALVDLSARAGEMDKAKVYQERLDAILLGR